MRSEQEIREAKKAWEETAEKAMFEEKPALYAWAITKVRILEWVLNEK